VAATFDDPSEADRASLLLRDRLGLAIDAVGSAPVHVAALPVLALTLVAGRVPRESIIEARRILTGFGGRIVADVEEPSGAAGQRRRGRGDGRAAPAAGRGASRRPVDEGEPAATTGEARTGGRSRTTASGQATADR